MPTVTDKFVEAIKDILAIYVSVAAQNKQATPDAINRIAAPQIERIINRDITPLMKNYRGYEMQERNVVDFINDMLTENVVKRAIALYYKECKQKASCPIDQLSNEDQVNIDNLTRYLADKTGILKPDEVTKIQDNIHQLVRSAMEAANTIRVHSIKARLSQRLQNIINTTSARLTSEDIPIKSYKVTDADETEQ